MFGIVGGIIGGIVVFLLSRYVLPAVPTVAGLFTLTSFLKLLAPSTAPAVDYNLATRIIIGIVMGAIFGASLASMPRYKNKRMTFLSGLGFGLVAGIIVWIILNVFGVTLLDLTATHRLIFGANVQTYLLYTFFRYVIFGLVMGAIVGALLPKFGIVYRSQVVQTQVVQTPS